jgi:hypothetical protein
VRLNDDRLPSLSSITHEGSPHCPSFFFAFYKIEINYENENENERNDRPGIFYEHYFDVGTEDEALFSCDWSFASSKDPIRCGVCVCGAFCVRG